MWVSFLLWSAFFLLSYLQIYKFPQSSLAELARNSVKQSGFEMEVKRHWLGHEWYLPGAAGNDINKVCVLGAICPSLRLIILSDADERSKYSIGLPTPDLACRTWHDWGAELWSPTAIWDRSLKENNTSTFKFSYTGIIVTSNIPFVKCFKRFSFVVSCPLGQSLPRPGWLSSSYY